MKDMTLSPEMKETVRKAQIDEETGAILYGYLGRKQKDEKNRKCSARCPRMKRPPPGSSLCCQRMVDRKRTGKGDKPLK